MTRAIALLCLAACSSKGGPTNEQPRVEHDAGLRASAADAAVAVATPIDAAPAPCVPSGDALSLAFDGTTAIVCADDDRVCVAVTEDGRVATADQPDEMPDALDVTADETGKTVAVCSLDGACKTLKPKLPKGGHVSNAEPDPSGRYVLLTIPGDFGDPTWIEVWDAATAKKRAGQKLPWNDDEGESISAEWAGSLVVVYRQPGPRVPGSGTAYSVGKKALAKVKDLPGLTAWASLDGQALFAVADGPKILAFDDAGKALPAIDASWLVDGEALEGVYELAAAGGRIVILADAAVYEPPIARVGFVASKTAVDVPVCATR